MFNYSNFAIISSFFALWFVSFFSKEIQTIIGFVLIFSFGIIHGANDLLLIQKIKRQKNIVSILKTTLYYVIMVFVGALLFNLIPTVALILFIIVSAYHFGEQHWQDLKAYNMNYFNYIFQFVYGMFILFMLFYFHQSEVQNIILQITGIYIPSIYITLGIQFFGIIWFILCAYLYFNVENLRKKIPLEIFYLLVFTLIFISSSLIWGFAIYFIIWHSIPSIIDQIKFLKGNYNTENLIYYFKSALIYWIASLSGIALLYFIFKDEKIFNALFFSFLAAITFPHALVILKMFNRKD